MDGACRKAFAFIHFRSFLPVRLPILEESAMPAKPAGDRQEGLIIVLARFCPAQHHFGRHHLYGL